MGRSDEGFSFFSFFLFLMEKWFLMVESGILGVGGTCRRKNQNG